MSRLSDVSGEEEVAVFWKGRGLKPSGNVEREYATPAVPETGLVAPVPMIRSSLGSDTVINGRLSFSEPTRIDGTLRGEVRASDMLVVGESAVVEGVVHALKLVVLGHVRGEVRGAEHVEIGSRGRLIGTVEAQTLVVREGGQLEADCHISPPRVSLRIVRPAAEKVVNSQ
jgi:cytoskeletal protein CcmA (bactofilin family)